MSVAGRCQKAMSLAVLQNGPQGGVQLSSVQELDIEPAFVPFSSFSHL